MDGNKKTSNTGPANGFSLSSIVRALGEQAETDRPFIPIVGGPRVFILMLYAAVLVAASLEFFLSQDIVVGGWHIYNTFLFLVSGMFVFIGMVLLLTTESIRPDDDYLIPIPKNILGLIGVIMFTASAFTLVIFGKEIGAWAIPLSMALIYGLTLIMLSTRGIGEHDGLRLILYATGLILMILVPVHEAFGIAQDSQTNFPWSFLNLVLLTIGMTFSVLAAQSLRTRDGYLGAWLMGAMAIFLLAFHEQLGIVASGYFSEYDRALALIGIAFSFLPLVMYVWREKVYIFLWSRLNSADELIRVGDYKGALLHADAALKQCSRAGIEDRFALPWTLKADAHYRLREYEKAKIYYENALQIDPKDAVTWNHMGNMNAFEGKLEDAMKNFDRALEIDPSNAYAWNNKGVVYQSMRMYEDALISFDKAIGFDPQSFDAHINKARLLARLGHSNEAVPEFQTAWEINPASEDAKRGVQQEFFRAKCLDQIDGWEQLGMDTSHLRMILDEDPSNFVRRSKEFLAKIVEQQEQLKVLPSTEHIDMNAAIKTILAATEGDGATLETLAEVTGLSWHNLILPLALLMETEHVHFRTLGKKQVYVSKGKAPEKPPEPPPLPPKLAPAEPKKAEKPRSRISARIPRLVAKPAAKPVAKPPPKPEPKLPVRKKVEMPEPTASILVFRRRETVPEKLPEKKPEKKLKVKKKR
jgi:tetratricopeptide (TPR) repeat protein